MAVLSNAISNLGRTNLAYGIINMSNNSFYDYLAMGFGNGTTAASVNDTDLAGNYSYYADQAGTYEADYKGVWEHTVNFSDIPDHIYSEAVVCKNASENVGYTLGRMVFDPITLNLSDQLQLTMKISFP